MEEYSKLIISIAALLSAIAWPLTILIVVIFFSGEIRSGLSRVANLFDRVKKASVAGFEFEIERLANSEVSSGKNEKGNITPQQIEAATRISKEEVSRLELRREMDKLALEYEAIRRALPSSNERTTAMTRVVVKMRLLALSLIDDVAIYKGSGSVGSRLAAITIMQMDPRTADLQWLKERFSNETPFVFYHAALALSNFANVVDSTDQKQKLRTAAKEALTMVEKFDGGKPDQNTIAILKPLVE